MEISCSKRRSWCHQSSSLKLIVSPDSFGSKLECTTISVTREPVTLLKTAINRPLSITFAHPNTNEYAIVYSNEGGRVGQVVGGIIQQISSIFITSKCIDRYMTSLIDGVVFDLNGAEIYNTILCLDLRDDIKLKQSDYPVPDFGYKQDDNDDIRPLGMTATVDNSGDQKRLCLTISLMNFTGSHETALFPIYRLMSIFYLFPMDS